MTLTVCVGSSGSGKTTFLNQVHELHHCTYLRQYHSIRPYIIISKIPNFDATKLPYWNIYEKEGTADSIVAGGTIHGKFVAGLSGGQRKLLLFEMIYQRCKDQEQLLIVLDEPFAGVTDDFVPFVVDRLNKLRHQHNILLVTNDHVETLTRLADNTITVSAIDRSKVKLNGQEGIDRNNMLIALSVGYVFQYKDSSDDLNFFLDVELYSNKSVRGIFVFALIAFGLYIATFWDSSAELYGALVLIASGLVGFFCLQPYLASLSDWRNCMLEEAEALVHASPDRSKALKTIMTMTAMTLVSVAQFFAVNAVTNAYFLEAKFWIAMLCESLYTMLPSVLLGIFTQLPFQTVQILSGLPFLLIVFFSTTYSPGAGVPGLKGLRYLFSRFYYFCMVDSVELEGCPEDEGLNILLMIITSLESLFIFLFIGVVSEIRKRCTMQKEAKRMAKKKDADEIQQLQEELYGGDQSIISLCAPVPELPYPTLERDDFARPKKPTAYPLQRADPSGNRASAIFEYPPLPKVDKRKKRNAAQSFFDMTVIGV